MSSKHICVSKRQYFSEWAAEIHASDINLELGQDNFSVYKFPYCNFYSKKSETY